MSSNIQEEVGGLLDPSRGYKALTMLTAFAERPKAQISCVSDPVHRLTVLLMNADTLSGPALTPSSKGAFCLPVVISTEMAGGRVWGIQASEVFSAEYPGGKVLYT